MFSQNRYKSLPKDHTWEIKPWSARCSKCDFICYKRLAEPDIFEYYWESGALHFDEIIPCKEYILAIKMHSALE